jgi:hypothetical protein
MRNITPTTAPSTAVSLDAQSQSDATRLRHLHRQATEGLRRVIALGLFCFDLKARIAHGQFAKWVQDACPDISHRSLQSYMHLTAVVLEKCGVKVTDLQALASKHSLPHSGDFLLEGPDSTCGIGELVEIRDSIIDVVSGKTAKQLFFEFREEQTARLPRAYHAPKRTPEQKIQLERAEAEEIARTLLADMHLVTTVWSQLSTARQQEIEEARQTLGNFIRDHSPRHNRK